MFTTPTNEEDEPGEGRLDTLIISVEQELLFRWSVTPKSGLGTPNQASELKSGWIDNQSIRGTFLFLLLGRLLGNQMQVIANHLVTNSHMEFLFMTLNPHIVVVYSENMLYMFFYSH